MLPLQTFQHKISTPSFPQKEQTQDPVKPTTLALLAPSVIWMRKMGIFGVTSVMIAELKKLATTNANQAVGIVSIEKKREF